MYKIVINSEIHLHQCLFQSRGFKSGISSYKRRPMKKKKNSWKFCKIDREILVSESDAGFSLSALPSFWEQFFTGHFQATTFDEYAWWSKIYVCVTSFSQFTTLQCSSGIMTIFWCNEERFLIKKTWLNSNSQTLSLTLFQR